MEKRAERYLIDNKGTGTEKKGQSTLTKLMDRPNRKKGNGIQFDVLAIWAMISTVSGSLSPCLFQIQEWNAKAWPSDGTAAARSWPS